MVTPWNKPKPPSPKGKGKVGPLQIRIPRLRTRVWAAPRGSSGMFTQIIKAPEPHVAANNPVYNGLLDKYARMLDTIPNPEWDFRYPILDDGGEMLSQTSWWVHNTTPVHFPYVGGTRLFGNLWASVSDVFHDGQFIKGAKYPPAMDYTDVKAKGPTGFARARPDRPRFNFGQSLVELRELPKMLHERLESIKDITSGYVGVEFGWTPLLADIKRMLDLQQKLDTVYRGILRNNGLPVRRRSFISSSNETAVLVDQPNNRGLNLNTQPLCGIPGVEYGTGYRRVDFRKTRNFWFSGKFIDYIDDSHLPSTEVRIKSRLLGLKLTPKLAWDLIPWSWLIDWFTNIGDLISNLSSTWADRELCTYAYVMGSTHRVYTWTGSDGRYTASSSKHFWTKSRYYADRFGFDSGTALSLTQQAILLALGLVRIGPT